jgi:hypothetical protein
LEKMRRAERKQEFNAPIESGQAPRTESGDREVMETWALSLQLHAEGRHGSIVTQRDKHGMRKNRG